MLIVDVECQYISMPSQDDLGQGPAKTLPLGLSMHEPMLSLSLSMHEPILSLSMLFLDTNHPD